MKRPSRTRCFRWARGRIATFDRADGSGRSVLFILQEASVPIADETNRGADSTELAPVRTNRSFQDGLRAFFKTRWNQTRITKHSAADRRGMHDLVLRGHTGAPDVSLGYDVTLAKMTLNSRLGP
jgi:hypothetical protein